MGQRFATVPVRGCPARILRKTGGTPVQRFRAGRPRTETQTHVCLFRAGCPRTAIGQIVALIYNFQVIPSHECQS